MCQNILLQYSKLFKTFLHFFKIILSFAILFYLTIIVMIIKIMNITNKVFLKGKLN